MLYECLKRCSSNSNCNGVDPHIAPEDIFNSSAMNVIRHEKTLSG